jgi:hypothetical protein
MRMRQLWVSDAGISLDPEISAYFVAVAGKRPADSPDAWSVLRATEARKGKRRLQVGNLERWLHQNESAPAARSRPVRPLARPAQASDWDEAREWTARGTERAAGADRLDFDLDDTFLSGPSGELGVKVTWIDRGTRWKLVVRGASGQTTSLPVEGVGDGSVKTTTFVLSDFATDAGAPDLSLVAEHEDLEVSVVRVLRKPDRDANCRRRAEALVPGLPEPIPFG